jgi:hypothetical protein
MRPKLVFVVMSAVQPVATVKDLCRALAPHTVLVHHDFSQAGSFVLDEPNAMLVPDPKKTGWGVWGFTEGIFHALQFAVRNLEFDYLQLLSPTCLPIKPLRAFEEHIEARTREPDFSGVDLYDDRDALMTVGYRMFAREHTFAHRVLRRLSLVYFGDSPDLRDVAGVQLRTNPATRADGSLPWRARIALKVTEFWSRPAPSRHLFNDDFRPYFGSAWFGARREVVAWLLERYGQPEVMKQFSRLRIPEELLIPSLLKNSGFKDGAYNHCILTFHGANPQWIGEEDFEVLRRSPAFFARKFPVETDAPIRQRVLRELVGTARPALETPARERSLAGTATDSGRLVSARFRPKAA